VLSFGYPCRTSVCYIIAFFGSFSLSYLVFTCIPSFYYSSIIWSSGSGPTKGTVQPVLSRLIPPTKFPPPFCCLLSFGRIFSLSDQSLEFFFFLSTSMGQGRPWIQPCCIFLPPVAFPVSHFFHPMRALILRKYLSFLPVLHSEGGVYCVVI